MKNSYKHHFRKIFSLLIILAAFAYPGFTQVGFDNPDPDSSALIDMKAKDKGLLVPRMTTNDRVNMTMGGKSPAHALLVFDLDQNMFFVYDTISNPDRWVSLNPWAALGSTADIITSTSGNIGIGTTVAPTAKLQVNGNIKADNDLIANGDVTANNVNLSGSLNSTSISSDNINATGTIIATSFSGNGVIPIGGIIMWSGSIASIPAGWALCDGINGTPNLSGRFIVSAGTFSELSGTYIYVPGNTGGEAKHTLTIAEIPSHTHSYTYEGDSGSGGIATSGAASFVGKNGITAATGGGAAHENRPPYYALAYIMRIQ